MTRTPIRPGGGGAEWESERERLVRIETQMGQLLGDVGRLTEKVDNIEQDMGPLKARTGAITRGLWLVASSIIMAAGGVIVAFVVKGGLLVP